MGLKRVSEVRTEDLLGEILRTQGWDIRRPPQGDLLRQQEYKNHSHLLDIFKGKSKTHKGGDGLPDALIVDRSSCVPILVIEEKADKAKLDEAVREATTIYGRACIDAGYSPLAVGLAGTSEDEFDIRVLKWNRTEWSLITYEGKPINWIPNKSDVNHLQGPASSNELRPTIPPPEILAECAEEINRLLRESSIKDELRPAVLGAIMLGLWQSKGNVRKVPKYILKDINQACTEAFGHAKKPDLAKSLRVDEANDLLAVKARRIVTILERLNVAVLTAEHDYLGQLYEAFFQYTGGNTIGQYFTPRHIARMMADLCEVSPNDVVLDPACGTGGFLIAAMNRVREQTGLSREQSVKHIQTHLIGYENEPITAALCIANMILRGDGSTAVKRDNCFSAADYPIDNAHVVLMNPPFPHRKTDTPLEEFVDRGLQGLQQNGRLAVIVPMSVLSNRKKQRWREKLLAHNTLSGIIQLPADLFRPYSALTTAILLVTKGLPHPSYHRTFFARIVNDGYRLRKGVRVDRSDSQIPQVLDAYHQKGQILGTCCVAKVSDKDEWAPGVYIPAKPLLPEDILDEIDGLIRNKSSTIVQYAPKYRLLREAIRSGRLEPKEYVRKRFPEGKGEDLGAYFKIYYGQYQLRNMDCLTEGDTPIISAKGIDNGCCGFYDYDDLIKSPIVTVARVGPIGKGVAHVQEWSCAVTDSCLVLVPLSGVPIEVLYAAAAVVRKEGWRFSYARKITPERIAHFQLPTPDDKLLGEIRRRLDVAKKIEDIALEVNVDTENPPNGE
jgi:hypothetical protein